MKPPFALRFASRRCGFAHQRCRSRTNAAERAIRPAVMICKNSCASQSVQGASMMAAMMSVLRTLKLNKTQLVEEIFYALLEDNRNGSLLKINSGR